MRIEHDELEEIMEQKKKESANIDEAERLLNDNWNERKQLVNREFDLREKTLELLLKRDTKAAIDEARREVGENRRALANNTDEYENLLNAWIATLPPQ